MTDLTGTVSASQLWFTAPLEVEVRNVALAPPGPGEVRVKTRYSAVSAGTELLLYRGQIPQSMALDSTLESLQQAPHYPVQFGYACIGDVQAIGSGVDATWAGQRVFGFQPHASHFLALPEHLIAVPDDIVASSAVFLPNMETAVNLIQDGQPMMGERVVVLGQGVVGLLLSALLAQYPLASLAAVEGQLQRQQLARRMGVQSVWSPAEAELPAQRASGLGNADLIYEVSGHPQALNLAIGLGGYASRIVIGSWYGNKPVSVDLGGDAHRNRLQLMTSQVSTLAPALSGRWDKRRRFDLAWDMIRRVDPGQLVTQTLPLQEAPALYHQLHEQLPDIVQPLFHYPD
ncbi:zinc-dependent alcohol dehydrogenase [Chromatocurvus halotolerans]|uniref:2-desacetyl-2-hydroxyethyl bacteriochlorophyllide A dehydrogenase n=1 Tax=Chromatocurvus halotolerans TaxID=1132028 RepID=A0A4R2KN66_9GAMM|nr:zinc-binding alcohol dehydrogenase [Chromatocurvus halotolerans]TCO75591.1 2-desacetyl-2-hydroxyethyl bacteriochlorophyllide A dehydrogenase [Chromatocurvus halotolerans]